MLKIDIKKLGVVNIAKDRDGYLVFDKHTILSIYDKALTKLNHKDLISLYDKELIQDNFRDCRFEINEKLSEICSIEYVYTKGFKGVLKKITIDSNIKYLDASDTINQLLSELCLVITIVFHSEVNIRYKLSRYRLKESEWERYAQELCTDDEISRNRYYNEVVNYMSKSLTDNEHKRLKSYYMENIVEDDEMDIGEYWFDFYVIEYINYCMDLEYKSVNIIRADEFFDDYLIGCFIK